MSARLAVVVMSPLVQGLSFGIVGATLMVVAGLKVRQRCKRRRHSYERVCHELDAEERDFKKALEGQTNIDKFSDDEAAQLEMIEKYRSSLLNQEEDDDDEDLDIEV